MTSYMEKLDKYLYQEYGDLFEMADCQTNGENAIDNMKRSNTKERRCGLMLNHCEKPYFSLFVSLVQNRYLSFRLSELLFRIIANSGIESDYFFEKVSQQLSECGSVRILGDLVRLYAEAINRRDYINVVDTVEDIFKTYSVIGDGNEYDRESHIFKLHMMLRLDGLVYCSNGGIKDLRHDTRESALDYNTDTEDDFMDSENNERMFVFGSDVRQACRELSVKYYGQIIDPEIILPEFSEFVVNVDGSMYFSLNELMNHFKIQSGRELEDLKRKLIIGEN